VHRGLSARSVPRGRNGGASAAGSGGDMTALPRPIGPYGARYDDAIDLAALACAHPARFRERTTIVVDGNVAAAIPFLQWWRAPLLAGFPITPATKWLEHLAAEVASGRFDAEIGGKRVPSKRLKQLESE